MITYSVIILIAMAIIATLNCFFNPLYSEHIWVYILAVTVLTILVILLDGLVAFIIRKMPERWFSETKGFLRTGKREMKLFNFLRVQKWKEHVPELGSFTGFHKNKVTDPFDTEYMARFILEARYGIAIHYISVPLSFLIMLLDFKMYVGESNLWLTVALPVACVNAVLILLPAFVLKYNLPKLERIQAINLKKQNKK